MKTSKKILCVFISVLLVFATILTVSAVVIFPVGDFEITPHNDNYAIYSFDNDSKATTVYVYGEYNKKPIDYVYPNVFSGNTKLITLIFKENIVHIDQYVCLNNSNLENVTFPESLTTIGKYAFYNCPKLTSVTIGKNVTSIGEKAFGNNSNLVISCYKDSYAETYAKTNGISYILIDDPQPTETTTQPITETETETQPVTQPVKETFIVGDVNDDKSVTITDATMIQQVIAKLISSDEKMEQRGDTSFEGSMSISDVTRIQQYLASIEVDVNHVGETREYK